MREIKFRGKHIETGEWFKGDFLSETPAEYPCITTIMPYGYDSMPINIDTLGQLIGLKDKYDTEIYEGDIVKVNTLGINYERKSINGIVKIIDSCATVVFLQPIYDISLKAYRKSLYVKCFTINASIKVIGNIHDNPELLKEGAK